MQQLCGSPSDCKPDQSIIERYERWMISRGATEEDEGREVFKPERAGQPWSSQNWGHPRPRSEPDRTEGRPMRPTAIDPSQAEPK
jgi:hypothetical protein